MITVIGAGSGNAENLSIAAWNAIKNAKNIVLKTEKMPVKSFLDQNGIAYTSLDDIYETSADFDELNAKISEHLSEFNECAYIVQGNGLDDTSVSLLKNIRIIPGVSVCDTACAFSRFFGVRRDVLAYDIIGGYRPSCRENTAVYCIDSKYIACDIKCILCDIYGDEYPVKVYVEDFSGNQTTEEIPLYKLDMLENYNHTFCLLLSARELTENFKHGIDDVLEITDTLYSQCPWDSEQTHESLRRFLIEEAYEVADAIDKDDPYALFDELGDVLYQITLHSAIAKSMGDFDFYDVCDAICTKMMRRHPAIFGGDVRTWDEIKKDEKGFAHKSDALDDIPKSLPALMYAEKLQYKAEKSGMYKPQSENNEFINGGNTESDIGKMLFDSVSFCRKNGISPENALHAYCADFLDKLKCNGSNNR